MEVKVTSLGLNSPVTFDNGEGHFFGQYPNLILPYARKSEGHFLDSFDENKLMQYDITHLIL
jgi:hypothetical protein